MMGTMRNMGMNVPEMNVAAQNARTFARMAGTTVQGVIQAGSQGADIFSQYGMTRATGLNVGMAAAGLAGNVATWMKPRELEMLGGRGGIQQSLTGAAAQVPMDVFLPAMATLHDGHLGIDPKAIRRLASGEFNNIQSLVRESQKRLSGMGPRGFVEAYSTQKEELQDAFMNELGGTAGTLMPLMYARMMKQTGVAKTMGGALSAMGYDEKTARSLELIYQNEGTYNAIRDAARPNAYERQGGVARSRIAQGERASEQTWRESGKALQEFGVNVVRGVGVPLVAGFAAPFVAGFAPGLYNQSAAQIIERTQQSLSYADKRLSSFFSERGAGNADIEEQRRVAGGGDLLQVIRPDVLMTDTRLQQMREVAKTPVGERDAARRRALLENVDKSIAAENKEFAEYDDITPNFFHGAEGYGFGPKSAYIGDVVRRNQGFKKRMQVRLAGFTGLSGLVPTDATWQNTPEAIQKTAEEQISLGSLIESAVTKEGTAAGLRGLQRLVGGRKKRGISQTDTVNMIAQGAEGLKTWASEQYGSVLGFEGELRPQDMMAAVQKALGPGMQLPSDERERSDLMVEIINAARATGDEHVHATLNRAVRNSTDLLASQSGQRVRHTMSQIQQMERTTLSGLGLFEGQYEADEGRKLLDFFAETGDEAEVRKKLYAIAVMRKTNTPENNARALQMETEIKLSMDDKKYAKLKGEVDGLVAGLSPEVAKAAGKQLTKTFKNKDGTTREVPVQKLLDMASQGARENLKDYPIQALTEQFGAEFVDEYVKQTTPEGRQAFIKKYMESTPSAFTGAGYSKGDMAALAENPLALESIAAKKLRTKAQTVVSGGNTSETSTETGLSETAGAIVDVLEKWSQEDRKKFGPAVEKFGKAAGHLQSAAEILAHGHELKHVANTVHGALLDKADGEGH